MPLTAPTCTVYRASHLCWCACQGASNLESAVGLQAGCTALLACPAYLKRQKTSTTPSYRLSDALQLHRSVRYSCNPGFLFCPHRRRRPPKTLLCVILSCNPQCLVHCPLALPTPSNPPPHRVTSKQHKSISSTRYDSLSTCYSLTHPLTAQALSPTPNRPALSPHGPGTRETLRHLAFLSDRVVVQTCRNTKRT